MTTATIETLLMIDQTHRTMSAIEAAVHGLRKDMTDLNNHIEVVQAERKLTDTEIQAVGRLLKHSKELEQVIIDMFGSEV